MELILIRHGNAEYLSITKKENLHIWKNFAGLSEEGKVQASELAKDKTLLGAELILSSPYTRAIETANIIAKELNIPTKIEFDLREWDQEVSKQFNKIEFEEMLKEMIQNKGRYNEVCKYKWESLDELGNRVFNVIRKYGNYNKIIVVTHMMVITQFLYKHNIKECEIIKVKFDENTKPNGFVET